MDPSYVEKTHLSDYLWGKKSSIWFLIAAALLILLLMLSAKSLWTQEWRWANICSEMLRRHDFFHPYLAGQDYYDKPLLSYWAILGIASLMGKLNIWAIRLPSVIAALITLLCTVRIGTKIISKQAGLIAGWLLITTYYFVFWARIGSSDMLNLAGIMLCIMWYFERRAHPGYFTYIIFFTLLALSALFKGLVAPAVVIIALLPDFIYTRAWKLHFNLALFISIIPGIIIYFLPFFASMYFNPQHYGESGILMAFQESFLRYFKPFDHQQPFYIYFIDLPLYTLPWILFAIPAFITFPIRRSKMPPGSRWTFWSMLFILLLFFFSGSRRNYYMLNTIPFVMLFTAQFIYEGIEKYNKFPILAGNIAGIFYVILLLIFGAIYPLAYCCGGESLFAQQVQEKATQIRPWKDWNITLLATRNNLTYYLHSPNEIIIKNASDNTKNHPTKNNILKDFTIITHPQQNDLIILGADYVDQIKDTLKNYTIINTQPTLGERLLRNQPDNAPVALVPIQQPETNPIQPSGNSKQQDQTSIQEKNTPPVNTSQQDNLNASAIEQQTNPVENTDKTAVISGNESDTNTNNNTPNTEEKSEVTN